MDREKAIRQLNAISYGHKLSDEEEKELLGILGKYSSPEKVYDHRLSAGYVKGLKTALDIKDNELNR